jgi:hypothetical protein
LSKRLFIFLLVLTAGFFLIGNLSTPPEPAPQNFGYQPNPVGTQKFLATLARPTIRQAAPQLFAGAGDDQDSVLLYRALYEAKPGWTVGKQGIGDCVSWGWSHGADVLLAVEQKLGTSGAWKQAATEAVYGGSRTIGMDRSTGGWSDGSYGGAAAKYVTKAGILFRQPYPGVDLSEYSAQRAKQWGNFGVPADLLPLAKEHPIKTVALVSTFEEAATAIKNGYPVPVCSGQGFSSTRDSDGFARPQGSWSHCMVLIGVRGGNRPGLLCLNSWGPNWISGPKWPADQPDGSFWVDIETCNRMLSGRDSFAVSNYLGFPVRKLNNSLGW